MMRNNKAPSNISSFNTNLSGNSSVHSSTVQQTNEHLYPTTGRCARPPLPPEKKAAHRYEYQAPNTEGCCMLETEVQSQPDQLPRTILLTPRSPRTAQPGGDQLFPLVSKSPSLPHPPPVLYEKKNLCPFRLHISVSNGRPVSFSSSPPPWPVRL